MGDADLGQQSRCGGEKCGEDCPYKPSHEDAIAIVYGLEAYADCSRRKLLSQDGRLLDKGVISYEGRLCDVALFSRHHPMPGPRVQMPNRFP
jgi:hypothetical protein